MATTGLLESARGPSRKGGLRGWLGEMTQNPTYNRVLDLINTPTGGGVETTVTPTATGQISTLPSPSLAQSPTAATQVGAPPLTAIEPKPDESYAVSPTGAQRIDETVQAPTEMAPPPTAEAGVPAGLPGAATIQQRVTEPQQRQVFMTPEEEIVARYSGQERGELEGVIKTLTPYIGREAAVKQALEERQRSRGVSGADRSIFGEILQPNGTWKSGSVIFDPQSGKHLDTATGQPVRDFRRNVTTGSANQPTDARRIMQELFPGRNLNELTGEETARLNAAIAAYGGTKTGAATAGRMEAAAAGPLATKEREDFIFKAYDDWQKASGSARKILQNATKLQTAWEAYQRNPAMLPAAAEAIIVTFERTLDENSVVREAEARRPGTFQGLLTRIEGAYQQLKQGGASIPPELLASYVQLGQEIAATASMLVQFERDRIGNLAKSFEVEPSLVFGADPIGAVATPPSTTTPTKTPTSGTPPPTATRSATPTRTATPPPGAPVGLDSAAPGIFVDQAGNLIRR